MEVGIYRHYKGGYYQVIGIGEHTETKEELVIYVSLDAIQPGPRIRARPRNGINGFESNVLMADMSSGIPRFKYVGNEIKL